MVSKSNTMKRGYFIFMMGTLVGMVLQQYVFKNETSVETYVTYFVLIMIFSFNRSTEVFSFFLVNTLMVIYLITWMDGNFRWYEPLIFLWMGYVLYLTVFDKKMNRPIFVDEGDVLRFPPRFVESESIDWEQRYNC